MRERLETSDIVAPRLWGTEKLTSKSSKFLARAPHHGGVHPTGVLKF